jgi:hypothetical protein
VGGEIDAFDVAGDDEVGVAIAVEVCSGDRGGPPYGFGKMGLGDIDKSRGGVLEEPVPVAPTDDEVEVVV